MSDIDKLPPHVRAQATKAGQNSGIAEQATASRQDFAHSEGVANAARHPVQKNVELQQEQQKAQEQANTQEQPPQQPER